MGKIVVIEGTDCSFKETQSKMLKERLKRENIKVEQMSFPVYSSPTGRIIGGPFLGKHETCEGWFPETAPNVDWQVASLYYAADRKYHLNEILKYKAENEILILDRYIYSNMGYQVSKLRTKEERIEGFKWIEKLELELLGLPNSDLRIFLHMPLDGQKIIKSKREEVLDQNEANDNYNKVAEDTYFEMAKLYDFKILECVSNGIIKTPEEIHEEVYSNVKKLVLK
ncbi:MAG: hypothetical protein HFE04_00720 [Bacilli bacterium]|nr:hypothetical protein [Bacilli bacterium]